MPWTGNNPTLTQNHENLYNEVQLYHEPHKPATSYCTGTAKSPVTAQPWPKIMRTFTARCNCTLSYINRVPATALAQTGPQKPPTPDPELYKYPRLAASFPPEDWASSAQGGRCRCPRWSAACCWSPPCRSAPWPTDRSRLPQPGTRPATHGIWQTLNDSPVNLTTMRQRPLVNRSHLSQLATDSIWQSLNNSPVNLTTMQQRPLVNTRLPQPATDGIW